jgi:hypothetical protein
VPDARRTADKFHILRLANAAETEVRGRRQQDLAGQRGRTADPMYAARRDVLRARHNLTERGWARLTAALAVDLDLDLDCAWVMKEALGGLYDAADRVDAQVALAEWYSIIEDDDMPELSRRAITVTPVGDRDPHRVRQSLDERSHRRPQPDQQSRRPQRLRVPQLQPLPPPRAPPLFTTTRPGQTNGFGPEPSPAAVKAIAETLRRAPSEAS